MIEINSRAKPPDPKPTLLHPIELGHYSTVDDRKVVLQKKETVSGVEVFTGTLSGFGNCVHWDKNGCYVGWGNVATEHPIYGHPCNLRKKEKAPEKELVHVNPPLEEIWTHYNSGGKIGYKQLNSFIWHVYPNYWKNNYDIVKLHYSMYHMRKE